MKKGEGTRELIIRQSARLFNLRGYHACSLQDIMKATKLQKGGIYNHFANKDEIALASFDYSMQWISKQFRSGLDKCSNNREKLFTILNVYAGFYDSPMTEGGCPIFNTAVFSSGTHAELTKKARAAINGLKRYIEIKIDDGVAAGEIKPEIKSEEVSSLIILTLEGALIMSRVNDDRAPVDNAVKHLRSYLKEYFV